MTYTAESILSVIKYRYRAAKAKAVKNDLLLLYWRIVASDMDCLHACASVCVCVCDMTKTVSDGTKNTQLTPQKSSEKAMSSNKLIKSNENK